MATFEYFTLCSQSFQNQTIQTFSWFDYVNFEKKTNIFSNAKLSLSLSTWYERYFCWLEPRCRHWVTVLRWWHPSTQQSPPSKNTCRDNGRGQRVSADTRLAVQQTQLTKEILCSTTISLHRETQAWIEWLIEEVISGQVFTGHVNKPTVSKHWSWRKIGPKD